jgi:hypothetical protein
MTQPTTTATTTANVAAALKPPTIVTAKQHTAYRIANGKAAAANKANRTK